MCLYSIIVVNIMKLQLELCYKHTVDIYKLAHLYFMCIVVLYSIVDDIRWLLLLLISLFTTACRFCRRRRCSTCSVSDWCGRYQRHPLTASLLTSTFTTLCHRCDVFVIVVVYKVIRFRLKYVTKEALWHINTSILFVSVCLSLYSCVLSVCVRDKERVLRNT